MLDITLHTSTPALLALVFVVASAGWALGSLLAREPCDGPFLYWPCRWFNLLDILAMACFIVVIAAVSFFLVHFRFPWPGIPSCSLATRCVVTTSDSSAGRLAYQELLHGFSGIPA